MKKVRLSDGSKFVGRLGAGSVGIKSREVSCACSRMPEDGQVKRSDNALNLVVLLLLCMRHWADGEKEDATATNKGESTA